MVGHKTADGRGWSKEDPRRQLIEQSVSPSIEVTPDDEGKRQRPLETLGTKFASKGKTLTNDTRNGQLALELRKEQVGLCDASFYAWLVH